MNDLLGDVAEREDSAAGAQASDGSCNGVVSGGGWPNWAITGVGLLSSAGDRLAPEPTDARPGTPEKVAVLAERAARGLCLWHPLDATREGMVGSGRVFPVFLRGMRDG